MKIALFGRLPPPVGGVTSFIKNLISAAQASGACEVVFLHQYSLCFRRCNAAHVNASHPAKRLLQLVLGRLIARRVYFSIHGGVFDEKNIFNRLSLKISSGVLCLNYKIKAKLDRLGVRSLIHTTVFAENISDYPTWVDKHRLCKNVVAYINSNRLIDGREIYGASFLHEALQARPSDLSLMMTVVDVSGSYRDLFDGLENVNYIDHAVDFRQLLVDSDLYIRPTSTDGMSLALLEATIIGVPCLASDVVDRPGPVVTYRYGSREDFLDKLRLVLQGGGVCGPAVRLTTMDEYLGFMLAGGE